MKEQTIAQWLAEQQALAGISDDELARELGYESGTVVQLLKAGQMKVPATKAPILAGVFGISPEGVMRRLLREISPELLHAVERCLVPFSLSDGERKLIAAIRKVNPSSEPVPLMFDRNAIITLVVA